MPVILRQEADVGQVLLAEFTAQKFEYLLCGFKAVELGEVQVHDDEFVAGLILLVSLLDHVYGLKAARHHIAAERVLLEYGDQGHGRVKIVLDHHDLGNELFIHEP